MSTPVRNIENYTPTPEEMTSAKSFIELLERTDVNAHLKEVITAMLERIAEGNSVSILSKNKEYTTGEAAEFLHVSKTYLLKVIDRGELPCRMVGKHRRIRSQDLLTYQAQMEANRTNALKSLYELSQKYETDE